MKTPTKLSQKSFSTVFIPQPFLYTKLPTVNHSSELQVLWKGPVVSLLDINYTSQSCTDVWVNEAEPATISRTCIRKEDG